MKHFKAFSLIVKNHIKELNHALDLSIPAYFGKSRNFEPGYYPVPYYKFYRIHFKGVCMIVSMEPDKFLTVASCFKIEFEDEKNPFWKKYFKQGSKNLYGIGVYAHSMNSIKIIDDTHLEISRLPLGATRAFDIKTGEYSPLSKYFKDMGHLSPFYNGRYFNEFIPYLMGREIKPFPRK